MAATTKIHFATFTGISNDDGTEYETFINFPRFHVDEDRAIKEAERMRSWNRNWCTGYKIHSYDTSEEAFEAARSYGFDPENL